MRFITLDSNGLPQYFLSGDAKKPKSAIEITTEEYLKYLEAEDQGKAFKLVNGKIVVSTPPDNRSIAQIKAQAIANINAGYTAAINSLLEGYPSYLVDTFFKQEKEADAWLLDQTTATPFIDSMASERGITKADAVERIKQRAATFSEATGLLTGKQQRLVDAVNAIQSDATRDDAKQIVESNEWVD